MTAVNKLSDKEAVRVLYEEDSWTQLSKDHEPVQVKWSMDELGAVVLMLRNEPSGVPKSTQEQLEATFDDWTRAEIYESRSRQEKALVPKIELLLLKDFIIRVLTTHDKVYAKARKRQGLPGHLGSALAELAYTIQEHKVITPIPQVTYSRAFNLPTDTFMDWELFDAESMVDLRIKQMQARLGELQTEITKRRLKRPNPKR